MTHLFSCDELVAQNVLICYQEPTRKCHSLCNWTTLVALTVLCDRFGKFAIQINDQLMRKLFMNSKYHSIQYYY